MRIPKREFPPAIKIELDRFLGSLSAATGSTVTPESDRQRQLATRQYWSARTVTATTWCLYPLAVMLAALALKAGLNASPAWALIPGALGAFPLHFAFPSTRGLTPDELRAYRPLMTLSEPESAFVDALAEAYSSGADPALRAEVIPAMRRLVEEGARLDRLEAQLSEGGSNSVRNEVDAMRARLSTLADESAREALRQGIAIAERRLGSAISESAARERIEAHRAMIRQAALAARETVRRLRLSPEAASAGDLDLSALRTSAEGASRDVAALETAVQEMRAL